MTEQPEIGYEQARDELVAIVQKLETGGLGLSESLEAWQRGEYLADVCQQWLDGARAKIDAASAEDPTDADQSAETPDSDEPDDSGDSEDT